METGFTCLLFASFLLMIWIHIMRLDCSVMAQSNVIVYFPSNCHYIQDNFVCEDVPVGIPANVTSVVVTALTGDNLCNKFKNTTWKHVKKLNLKGINVIDVDDNAFATLSSLTELTLHLPNVLDFHPMAFARLANLSKLEMLGMLKIRSRDWLPAIIHSLPGVESFTFNPGVSPSPPTFIFMTSDAEDFVIGKGINSLNVSNTLITTTDMAFVKTILSPQIDVLNISGSTVDFYYRDGKYPSNDTELLNSFKKRPLLKTYDISGCTYSLHPLGVIKELQHLFIFFMRYMTLIENFYADNIFHVAGADLSLDYNNYTDSPVFWKTLSVRENNITTVTGTLLINTNNTVHSFDASKNTIGYIQPECLSTLIHLQYINLAKNKLYNMQNNTHEFQSLFQMQSELVELDLSYNGISLIPFQTFYANINLEVLNLGFNRLTTVMFGLMKLRKLAILDLSGNQIQVIEGRYLSQLQRYIATMQTNSTGVILTLDDNPLLCACYTVTFVDWLINLSAMNKSKNSYYCIYQGERQRVDQSALDKSKYLCRRTMIIIVSVSVPMVLFVAILLVAGMLIRIRRNRKRIDIEFQFRKEFNRQKQAEQFMVFLAYASVDEVIVKNHLIVPMNETLKARLGTNRDVLATGYKFRPGFRITEETFRLIKLSHVFLALVTHNFCRSDYSIGELHEACKQRKPVILVFSGEVDENDMSPYLREIFKRVVRAKLVTVGNGAMEIIPSIENICESVIMLAIKTI